MRQLHRFAFIHPRLYVRIRLVRDTDEVTMDIASSPILRASMYETKPRVYTPYFVWSSLFLAGCAGSDPIDR